MNRTTNGFDKLSLADFLASLNNICGKMNANPYFPEQQTAVAALTARKNEYVVLAEKATAGSKTAILERDAKREIIVTALHNLGFEVTAVSQGDLLKLEARAFALLKTGSPHRLLKNLRLLNYLPV